VRILKRSAPQETPIPSFKKSGTNQKKKKGGFQGGVSLRKYKVAVRKKKKAGLNQDSPRQMRSYELQAVAKNEKEGAAWKRNEQ